MPTSRDTDDQGHPDLRGHRDVPGVASGSPDIEPAGGLTIDCDCCALRNTDACDDCVVSFLLEREPDDAVVIDADEARAMRMLERAGLVPDAALQLPGRLSRAGHCPGPNAGRRRRIQRRLIRWRRMKRHLLVTNDFPPKVGGIQNYLWDLWSRLDPASFVVLTASSDDGAAAFDAAQAERGIRIERVPGSILFFPTPAALAAVRAAVGEHEVDLVLLDPALPLGLLGPHLDVPYGVILHGAEVTVPGRLPGSRAALGPRAARGAARRVGRQLPGGRGPPRRART